MSLRLISPPSVLCSTSDPANALVGSLLMSLSSKMCCTSLDNLPSLKNIYTVHSGRLPVLCTVQIFSLLPEKVFDVCNSVVFLLLVSAMVRFSLPHTPNSTFLTTMGGVLLLYTAVPAFGQNFLWMTGSVNYLWTMTITVWFLQPFLHPNQMPNFHLTTIIWLILGLLSGWSMENQ